MKHEKTFEAIAKLKDIEIELHRLKNALEIANKALDAKREWVGMTDREKSNLWLESRAAIPRFYTYATLVEAKLKEKNTRNGGCL